MAKDKIDIVAGLLSINAYESITVDNTVKSLTAANYTIAGSNAKRILITVEDGQIRWRADGPDPTASEGHILNPMDSLILMGITNIQDFRCIRKTSTNGTIKVSYEF